MRRLPLSLFLLLLASPALSSPASAVTIAAKDIDTVAEEDRPNQRYFWEPTTDKKEVAELRTIFKYRALGLLSREPEFVDPVEVPCEGGILFRVDITEVGWDAKVLEKAADLDVYFHERIKRRPPMKRMKAKGKAMRPASRKTVPAPWLPVRDITHLRAETGSEAPIIRMGWFLFQTSRQLSLQNQLTGFGYYDMLGVKDRAGFFDLVALDEAKAIKGKREMRAALDWSTLTGTKGRQIFRLPGQHGGVWGTLDTDNPSGRGIAIANLERKKFLHRAEEFFGPLPNGLPAMLLCSDQGVLQNVAPEFVGHNTSPLWRDSNKAIHVGRCLSCHTEVLQPINDWVRRTYNGKGVVQRPITDKAKAIEFRRQYLSNLNKALVDDVVAYAYAVQLATVTAANPKGLTVKATATLDERVLDRYAEVPVTLDRFAAELGCTTKALLTALRLAKGAVQGWDGRLDPFLHDPPQTLTRTISEDVYSRAQYYLRGVKP